MNAAATTKLTPARKRALDVLAAAHRAERAVRVSNETNDASVYWQSAHLACPKRVSRDHARTPWRIHPANRRRSTRRRCVMTAILTLTPTIAMKRGDAKVTQYAQCGVIVVVPDCGDRRASDALGACPRCSGIGWWEQTFPVASIDVRDQHLDEIPAIAGAVAQCQVCGCTDDDCTECVERTGQPCYWVAPNVCSACVTS